MLHIERCRAAHINTLGHIFTAKKNNTSPLLCVTPQHLQCGQTPKVCAIRSTGFRPDWGKLPNEGSRVNGHFTPQPRPGRSNNIFNIRSLKGVVDPYHHIYWRQIYSLKNDIFVFTFGSCYMLFMTPEDAENKKNTDRPSG